MDIYNNYLVVDEKMINFTASSNNNDDFIVKVFSAIEFKITQNLFYGRYSQKFLVISDISNVSLQNSSELLAQIILWKWFQGTQTILKTFMLKKGGKIGAEAETNLPVSLVIRFLKKREVVENPCPPICSPDDDLTVHIGDSQLIISAHWLMSVSPMVKRMLSVEMKEKHQRAINLDGLGITMEQFSEFADAISISSMRQPFFPNPQNVLTFLLIADYFQIDWLKERCGVHLANCVEIPFSERFLLIERYKLKNLMHYFSLLLNELTLGK